MHVLHAADQNEEDLVRLLDHYVSVIKVLHLLGRRHIGHLVLWRLMMNWLVKVVHAENGVGLFVVVMNVLLSQEILVC